jgi:AcrR family transcriptional regulator
MSRSAGVEGSVISLPGAISPTDKSRALVGTANLSREAVKENQVSRLIDAIVLVAAESGVENAGVKSICQRAGISLSTFYQHFQTREELFLAAFHRGVDALFDEVGRTYLEGDVSWSVRAERSITAFLQILSVNPDFTRFFMVEARRMGASLRPEIDRTFERAYSLFMSAEPVSDLDIGIYELAQLVIGGAFAAVYGIVQEGRFEDLPDLAPKLTSFTLALFKARH